MSDTRLTALQPDVFAGLGELTDLTLEATLLGRDGTDRAGGGTEDGTGAASGSGSSGADHHHGDDPAVCVRINTFGGHLDAGILQVYVQGQELSAAKQPYVTAPSSASSCSSQPQPTSAGGGHVYSDVQETDCAAACASLANNYNRSGWAQAPGCSMAGGGGGAQPGGDCRWNTNATAVYVDPQFERHADLVGVSVGTPHPFPAILFAWSCMFHGATARAHV